MEREPSSQRTWNSPPERWKELKSAARSLRASSTDSEDRLWQALRNRRLAGARFRRQHAIGQFIVDFFCSSAKLVVEVDGSVHESHADEDRARQDYLERVGFTVLRVTNEEVSANLPSVLERIASHLRDDCQKSNESSGEA